MKTLTHATVLGLAGTLLAACDEKPSDGPPTIRLGDSVCVQCNMIISDERYATATIADGPRGPEPRLFDDFNCQVNYEIENPDEDVHARWSHDRDTSEWLRTSEAHFVMSPQLRTPMASNIAAFATKEAAETAKNEFSGELMTFDVAWKRLGFSGACCEMSECSDDSDKEGANNAP